MIRRIFTAALIMLIAVPSLVFGWGEVRKARKFMKAGMYPQAIAVLEQRINDSPDDEDAHFELGVCYIYTGNLSAADARFESAVRLEPDYGYKIGVEYEKAGTEALKRGGVNRALTLFSKAVTYQPALRKEIAKKCFQAGVAALDRVPPEDGNRSKSLFEAACRYDPSLKEAAARKSYEKFKSLLEMATAQNEDSGQSGIPHESLWFFDFSKACMGKSSVLTMS
ncbi:MAG: tetratricopeptide repeat protein [Deltaproteobacteria bacterium]|nr:tetratricopeptide repeat protein [Deltaproteobacteria bacterium]